jgi:hypothetical protein
MIKCPKCNSFCEIHAEIITCNSINLQWKEKGLGVKKIKDKKTLFNKNPDEIRLFINCINCDYISGNLNAFDNIKGYEEEIRIINEQLNAMY